MSAEPMSGAFAAATPFATPFTGSVPAPSLAMDAPLTYSPRARARDENALVQQHLPLVRRLAWHVHGSVSTAIEVEDLVQVGLVALVEAVAAFEDRGQVTLKQYLVTRLRGAMIDELRRHAAMTRGAIRRKRDYGRAVNQLSATLGRPPVDREIAAHMGVTTEKLRTEYETAEAVKYESIDEVYADDQPWFASNTPDAFEQLSDAQTRDRLIAAISSLPEREQMVIQLYHVEELNLEEIGQVLGVGAARVCQIKSSAHERLKKAMLRG